MKISKTKLRKFMLSYLLIEFQQHQRKDYSLTITSLIVNVPALITEVYHFLELQFSVYRNLYFPSTRL